jgi:hypothetical protein
MSNRGSASTRRIETPLSQSHVSRALHLRNSAYTSTEATLQPSSQGPKSPSALNTYVILKLLFRTWQTLGGGVNVATEVRGVRRSSLDKR